VPLYPGAQYIASYNAGRNQRFYLYGTTASFVDLVTFYRTVLKQRGTWCLMLQRPTSSTSGDFGRNDVLSPRVTVKISVADLAGLSESSPGGVPARFPTVIQIVRHRNHKRAPTP